MKNSTSESLYNFWASFNDYTSKEEIEKIETLNATFDYTPSEFCQNGIDPIPNVTTPGGLFSSTAGLVFVDTATGIVDLDASTPGTYQITYTVASGSPLVFMQSITINAAQPASISYNNNGSSSTTLCRSSSNPTPIITGVSGGEFTSSPDGLVFAGGGGGGSIFIAKPEENQKMMSSTGEIDLNASTPGEYVVQYTTPEGCVVASHTVFIVDLIDAAYSYGSPVFCQDGIDPAPIFSQPLPAGQGQVFLVTAGGSGLKFVDNDNQVNALIDLSESAVGFYSVQRVIFNNCGTGGFTSSTINLQIIASGNTSFSYSAATFCKNDPNPVATISGTNGGMFSSTDPNLIFADAATGEIDVTATPAGMYPIVYDLTGICAATSTPQDITIVGADASFSYAVTEYCSGDVDPLPTITGTAGGVFSNSSSSGLVINAGSGLIDLDASAEGPHEITYTTAGACAGSSTFTITIITNSIADFEYALPAYCQSDTNPSPVITGSGGGSFSSTAGLVFIDANTGEIDLSASTPGQYTLTYEIPDPCGIVVQKDITIDSENPTLSFETSLDDAPFIASPGATIDIELGRKLEIRFPETFNGTVSWSGPDSFSSTGTEVEISNDIQLSNSGTYTAAITFDVACGSAPTTYDFVVNVLNSVVRLSPKVFLQGAMLGTTDNLMRDDLRTLGYLPNDTPYSDGVSVDGSIFNDAALDADNIVDWVFIELRDAVTNTTVIDAQSAFVQKDGDIVDINGNTELTMTATTGGSYYIVIKHRNHLGIMTATPIALNTIPINIDFRDGSQATFIKDSGAEAQTSIGMPVGTVGMWAGDANGDNQITYFGASTESIVIRQRVFDDSGNLFNLPTYPSQGYSSTDVNMNGVTGYFGANTEFVFIRDNVFSNPLNIFNLPTNPVNQQLP